MRLAIDAIAATRGGATSQLVPFLAALVAAHPDWEITIFVPKHLDVDLPADVRPVRMSFSGTLQRMRFELFSISTAANRDGADCLLCLLNTGPVWPKIPQVIYQRNSLYFDRSWLRQQSGGYRIEAGARRCLSFLMCRRSDVVLTPTKAMAAMLTQWRLGRKIRPVVIPHGVDSNSFSFEPRSLDRSNIRIGVIGHAAPHKSYETAMYALRELTSQGFSPELHLTLAATGNPTFQNHVEDLVSLANRLGISDTVKLLGPTRDPSAFYRDIDILLAPSRTESFGLPLLEAMALGIPIVASDIPASRELCEGIAAFYPVGAGARAAAAIIGLVNEPALALERRLADGRARALGLDWGHTSALITPVLARAASRRRHPQIRGEQRGP